MDGEKDATYCETMDEAGNSFYIYYDILCDCPIYIQSAM